MFAFIARQPILDKEKDVYAYELMFRDGQEGSYPEHDEKKSAYIAQHFHALGLDDISGDKKSFISFTPEKLITGLPSDLDPDRIVIELNRDPSGDAGLMDACKHIKNLGFQLALDDPQFLNRQAALVPLVDIVKVDLHAIRLEVLESQLPRLADASVDLIAEHINTYDDFANSQSLGFQFFQGYFFSQPEARLQRDLPANKLTLIDLMGESSNELFNFERINEIIERDAALSYLLLRFINNPLINKRYKISSLRHALNYMGEVEIKKFIALLSLATLSDEKPLELTHMSLVRAKFFDLLSQRRAFRSNPPVGFLIGLFSLLDALLDQDIADILHQLPLSDEVNQGLLGQSAEFNPYFIAVRAFESGLWLNVIKVAKQLEIDQKELHGLYNQAIVWGNGVRQTLSSNFPKKLVRPEKSA
ncbi:EAL and HDOD domain-containing protein [Alteromonas oceanisediminis]|uniref:EAL and HDOD domain-containing protein n=1 Tax=Alteromonas oceanisediminis TaxID=2836180 RepID=UPI001BD94C7B|nr:HDOD domain-containing protein [Alteromonas oceanisediminis]MBT0587695.1 EAL domain-containing protein [Alteromonas oceanisediminis]